jgi:hypothetical protein
MHPVTFKRAIVVTFFFITRFFISLPSSIPQIRVVLSRDPVAILLPSGNVAMDVIAFPWPSNVLTGFCCDAVNFLPSFMLGCAMLIWGFWRKVGR